MDELGLKFEAAAIARDRLDKRIDAGEITNREQLAEAVKEEMAFAMIEVRSR